MVYGFSKFCELFIYEEWFYFGYLIDFNFYGNDGFGLLVGVGFYYMLFFFDFY